MYPRKILSALEKWAENPARKPLVLRGARQVGKTTVVRMFADTFDQFVPLNLELADDRKFFTEGATVSSVLEAIGFMKGISFRASGKTLLFIDEIQKSPAAVALLRYFHEEVPHLHVIAAGSSLESLLDTHISFPVGRVEFMLMHPFSFEEFLWALGERSAVEALAMAPVPPYAHEKLSDLFRRYMLVGGMPEAVTIYAESGELGAIDRIHESLVVAYLEDVEKYALSNRMAAIIRHVIATAWNEAGGRIRYAGFGNSSYLSRDVKEAFAALHKAFLFQVVHPVTATSLPLAPDTKKSPRLHTLDTGLVVFKTGMRRALFSTPDLSAVFSGRMVEHAVGQELLATSASPLHTLHFWVREKRQSNAEVDYIIPVRDRLVPVEVKQGASGRLRSLHAFVDNAAHDVAVRLYGGPPGVEQANTIAGKPFTLVNIPWYQAALVERYVERAIASGA